MSLSRNYTYILYIVSTYNTYVTSRHDKQTADFVWTSYLVDTY